MIGADPDGYFESCLAGWGPDGLSAFAPDQLAAYRAAWRDPAMIAAACADYRAAVTADLADDLGGPLRVAAPALVLWGEAGIMGRHYDVPRAWADRLPDMTAQATAGGHFFVDTAPDRVARVLGDFLSRQPAI
jgi:haloacetate dehalogenase